jgi:hypothetical protein
MGLQAKLRVMVPPKVARSSGLDISLLGVILAGIGVTLNYVADAAGSTPHIIRFFDASPDRSYPAMLPQDAALLLLSDPSTGSTSTQSATTGASVVSLSHLPLLLVALGLALVVAGPVWSWYYR